MERQRERKERRRERSDRKTERKRDSVCERVGRVCGSVKRDQAEEIHRERTSGEGKEGSD